MKTASITQTKNKLSALIDEVKRGETVIILDRGKPIARLTSILESGNNEEIVGRLERLERIGAIRRATENPDPAFGDEIHLTTSAGDSGALKALLQDRETGR